MLAIDLLFIVFILIIIYVFFKLNPRIALETFNRIFAFYLGLKKKHVKLSPTVSICYAERGKRIAGQPTLLLVHGFASAKDYFYRLIHCLPTSLHIIVIDLPGHGESTFKVKDDLTISSFVSTLKKFADALKLPSKDFNLLGVSMGGHISGVYAANYPNDLKSLLLICPQGIPNKHVDTWQKDFNKDRDAVFPKNADEFFSFMKKLTYDGMKIPRLFAEGSAAVLQKNKRVFQQVADNILNIESEQNLLEKELSKIISPTFVLWGKNDEVIDVACLDVIRKKMNKNLQTVKVIDKCGHSILIEKSKESADSVVEFLNSIYK